MCCNVSSLNSFQELVIGEKSLDGTPENNLFIPGKDKEGFILTRLLEEVDILLQGGMIMVRKKAFFKKKIENKILEITHFFCYFPTLNDIYSAKHSLLEDGETGCLVFL